MVETATLLVMKSGFCLVSRIALFLAGAATWGLLAYSFNRVFFYRARVLHIAWVGMKEAMEEIRRLDRLAADAFVDEGTGITELEKYLEREGWRHVWTTVGIGSAGGCLLAITGLSMNVPVALWAGQFVLFIIAFGGALLRCYTRMRHRTLIQKVEQFTGSA